MINWPLIENLIRQWSWVLVPSIGFAGFLLLFLLIIRTLVKWNSQDQINEEVMKAYKKFKQLLIKDLGGKTKDESRDQSNHPG